MSFISFIKPKDNLVSESYMYVYDKQMLFNTIILSYESHKSVDWHLIVVLIIPYWLEKNECFHIGLDR